MSCPWIDPGNPRQTDGSRRISARVRRSLIPNRSIHRVGLNDVVNIGNALALSPNCLGYAYQELADFEELSERRGPTGMWHCTAR
jgi:hypothetical protein